MVTAAAAISRLVLYIAIRCIHIESEAECSSVPYKFKSLAFVWLIILGLFALTASGAVAGPWLLLLILIALAVPALVLRNERPVSAIARSPKRPRIVSDARDQAPLDPGAIDVYRWENEGGAPPMYASTGIRELAQAAHR